MFGDDVRVAIDEIRSLETERRRIDARTAELVSELELSGVYARDGHSSAKVMVRHVARLSGPTAATRERVSRMMRDLPIVAEAYRAGILGTDQASLLGRVHGNARVRGFMVDAQDWFLRIAGRLSYRDFETEVRTWERLADQDGPEPNDRMHQARKVSLKQDEQTLTWDMEGRFASMMGAQISEIFAHYLSAERLADWEKARAERGDDACEADLPRTPAQRSADALWQVFQDAASADNTAVPPDFCHNIVWTADTYEEMLRRLDGAEPEPFSVDTYRCETLTGLQVEPYEAAAQSLVAQVRRVIVDAAGTVIDLGRARNFTGSSRKAVQLQSKRCRWPGCGTPVDQCQTDHVLQHSRGGRTNPGNGAPLCGRHNRHKETGYRTWRDPAGHWHTHRPDGTEIPA